MSEPQQPSQTTITIQTSTFGRLWPARCVEVGGHCWVEKKIPPWPFTGKEAPPLLRTCKHCEKGQVGTPQEAIRWEDAG